MKKTSVIKTIKNYEVERSNKNQNWMRKEKNPDNNLIQCSHVFSIKKIGVVTKKDNYN